MLHRGPIEAAIERARWGPFQHGGTLSERAAYLLRGIAQDHPFLDGNKRTAFEAADVFLGKNGLQLEVDHERAATFLVRIARGAVGLQEIDRWLERHARRA